MLDRCDLEPLFFAPFVSSVMRVEPAWIDYNGHLNMAYYNVLLDRAVDEVFALLGCGLDYVKKRKHSCFTAEAHLRYLRELHADMEAKRTVPFPDGIVATLARMKSMHANLPRPEAAGRRIAMPGKSAG